jgi:hypothetical protein
VVSDGKTVESGQSEGILPSTVLLGSVCFYLFDTALPHQKDRLYAPQHYKTYQRYIDSLTCQPGKIESLYCVVLCRAIVNLLQKDDLSTKAGQLYS